MSFENRLLTALPVVMFAWSSHGAAEAQTGAGAGQRHFDLGGRTSEQMLTALRAVGALRGASVVDDDTVQVEGSYEDLELAESIIWLLDIDTGADPNVERVPVASDGTVLARFALGDLDLREVAVKLRSETGIRSLATAEEPNVVLVRGKLEQVEAVERQVRLLREEGTRLP